MIVEPNWTRITRIENIPPYEGRPVRVGHMDIAIFNLNGRFMTIENKCPHQGGPLCDGIVSGATVVCPLHGWRFDLETGLAVRASLPACVTTYPTRVEDGAILVALGAGNRMEPEGSEAAA